MSTEDHMTIDERYKYLRLMQQRYRLANRIGQGSLLDEMQAVTQLRRKSLIRLLKGPLVRKPRSSQRGSTYGPDVEQALRIIAESFDYICAERLTPNLPWMAHHLAAHGELFLSPRLLDLLQEISVSTVVRLRLTNVRRILSRYPTLPRLPRKPPSRPNPLTQSIPMRRIPWDTFDPGHPSASSGCDVEVDLVHHSGPTASGQYVHSLQMIDVATTWSERRADFGERFGRGVRLRLTRSPQPCLSRADFGEEFG